MIYLVELAVDRGLFDPNIQPLLDALVSPPTTAYTKVVGHTWLVMTPNETPAQLFSRLQPHLIDKDRVFIISVPTTAQYFGWLPDDVWGWLKRAMEMERNRKVI